MKKVIYADRFFLAGGMEGPGWLEIADGKFGAFYKQNPFEGDNPPLSPADAELLDFSGRWVAPGMVDTHIHGLMNHDVMDNDVDGLMAISEGLLSCGVTSFLPTTLTADEALLDAVVKTIGDNYNKVTGAKIQGIFLEGPFFTEKFKGAQNPKYFSDPSLDILDKWQELSGGLIRKIAIAPEREGVGEFVGRAVGGGVAVALGHSDATYAQAKAAVDQGASIFVHTYNGMSPLNHREPGMVGAALTLKDVYCEIICDGHHSHPVAAGLVMKSAGHDHTVLITDCMMAGAMPDGDYMLGEFPVVKRGGAARIASGSLAGSVLEMKVAIKNVVEWGLATPEQAIRMATSVPAASVGIDDRCGRIAHGRDADFVVFSPGLELQATYLDGECRYEA